MCFTAAAKDPKLLLALIAILDFRGASHATCWTNAWVKNSECLQGTNLETAKNSSPLHLVFGAAEDAKFLPWYKTEEKQILLFVSSLLWLFLHCCSHESTKETNTTTRTHLNVGNSIAFYEHCWQQDKNGIPAACRTSHFPIRSSRPLCQECFVVGFAR